MIQPIHAHASASFLFTTLLFTTQTAHAGCHEDFFCTTDLAARWGLRGSLTRASHDGTSDAGGAGTLAYGMVGHGYAGWLRFSADLILGGGSISFEGGVGETRDVGPTLAITKRHELFARAGVDARILGNRLFSSSLVEVPRGSTGFRYSLGDEVLVEIGARAGIVAAGLYKAAPERRELEGVEWGGFGELHLKRVFLDASAMRAATANVGRLVMCATSAPGDFGFAVCGDGMVLDAGARASTAYVGVLFGFGLMTNGQPSGTTKSAASDGPTYWP